MRMHLLALIGVAALSLAPLAGRAAQDDPTASDLKKRAERAYLEGRHAEAVALDLEIVEKHPGTLARRYAVQMLGTLYEDNLADIASAMKWDEEFLEKYADPRQVPFYRKKLESLARLSKQQDAFAVYQRIRFANQGDEVMVKGFEALLKDHPDFVLKDRVESELGYAYERLDKRGQSYRAFETLSHDGKKTLSSTDRIAYHTASLHWKETEAWSWFAWAVVAVLWGAALLMKPWQRLDRRSILLFLTLALAWAALTAVRMPTYHSMETIGFPIIIPDRIVYLGAALNLTVLLWLLLLTRGQFWHTRRRALRWASPLLALLMTAAVQYLFVVHQPDGPHIMDVFAEQYERWGEEWSLRAGLAHSESQGHGENATEPTVARSSAGRSAP